MWGWARAVRELDAVAVFGAAFWARIVVAPASATTAASMITGWFFFITLPPPRNVPHSFRYRRDPRPHRPSRLAGDESRLCRRGRPRQRDGGRGIRRPDRLEHSARRDAQSWKGARSAAARTPEPSLRRALGGRNPATRQGCQGRDARNPPAARRAAAARRCGA